MFSKITGWFEKGDTIVTNSQIDLTSLQKTLKYVFNDQQLLIQAMSHRSFYIDSDKQLSSNERLEFLGDAVLDLHITEFLYKTFPKENEGFLSQKKAVLVSRIVLGKISKELGLGEFLILNKGEEKTGGRKRLSNLSNLFEAVLGAMYLDGGFSASGKFIDNFLISRHKELLRTRTYFNYKSLLLEFAQSKGWGTPQYTVVDESGPDHQKTFVIKVQVNNEWSAEGQGSNKKGAEQHAAQNSLTLLSDAYPELKKTLKPA